MQPSPPLERAQAIDARVERAMVGLLLQNSASAAMAVVLGALLMAPVLLPPPHGNAYLVWLACIVATVIVRFAIGRHFVRQPAEAWDIRRVLLLYSVPTLVTGVAWGMLALVFYGGLSPSAQTFLLVILVGVTAAAVPLLSANRLLYLLYVLPNIVGVVVSLLESPGTVELSLCAMMVVYLALMWRTVSRVHAALRDSFALRFSNLELIDDLQHEVREKELARGQLERHQDNLEATIAERTRDLEAARDAAEAASRAKSDFLAVMSHEIRTPMNGVLGMTDLLLRTELTDTQREYLQTCQGSAQTLLSLINDLLDFSKIESGQLQMATEPVRLVDFVDTILGLFAPEANRKGIFIEADIDEGLPEWVDADPELLRQVLINLVGNAVKFTDVGSVRIEVSPTDGGVIHFRVVDTGPGLEASVQSKIFDPFVQADSSTTRRYGGTGLGLAICHRLVNFMGGTIGLSSVRGEGACFWFRLPLPEADVPGKAVTAESTAVQQQFNARVLLADDNTVNHLVCDSMLKLMGCEVDWAQNGKEAVEAWASKSYDLILMDVSMPVLDGIEATEQIRAQESARQVENAIPIVALTAHVSPEDRVQCLDAGMDDFLTKPMTLEDLQAVVTRQLAHFANPA